MELRSKLELFQHNKEKVIRYREAIEVLLELGVDQIMLELCAAEPINPESPQAGTSAVASLYESLGAQRALHILFSLDDLTIKKPGKLVSDYGANAKLGVSEEQARRYSEELT